MAALVARWHQEGDAALLEGDEDLVDEIARVRTDRAAEALVGLRDMVEDRQRWEAAIAMAGRLPDGERSSYGPSFMGFLVERESGPHLMGGAFAGDVPLCPVCNTPSERVLTLAAGSVPFALSRDPSFIWYVCGCNALDVTSVQLRDDGQRVFYGPAGDRAKAAGSSRVIGPCSSSATPIRPGSASTPTVASDGTRSAVCRVGSGRLPTRGVRGAQDR